MGYLVNQGGRIVAIDDPKRYQQWLNTPGFRVATKEEVEEYQKERYSQSLKQSLAQQAQETAIYLATVSKGGTDGYGVASKNITDRLTGLGYKVDTYSDRQKIAVLFHNPYSILQIDNPFRIIYTMFESDKIPDDWNDYLEAADMVIVPSKWCRDVFAKAGIDAKVVPLGYDEKTYKYVKRTRKAENRRVFTFLHYNAFNIRKGFPEVFKAFVEEFEPDEPVKMVFKTTLNRIPLPITKEKYPNIDIVQGKVSDKQMSNIIKNADCFVFPSRGEGFGMTPLEAMATGLPTIVPNAHGITEYFDDRYMYEVKVKETCPGIYSRYKGMDVGKMVITDVKHLRAQMRYIYEHQKEAREKGKKASEYVKKWTFTETAKQLKDIFDEILSKPIPERKLKNVLSLEQIC